jgi:hypothetical protein
LSNRLVKDFTYICLKFLEVSEKEPGKCKQIEVQKGKNKAIEYSKGNTYK